MATEVQRLLQPHDPAKSQQHVLYFINKTFPSLRHLENQDALLRVVDEAQQKAITLGEQLQQSQVGRDEHIARALAQTREHLASARELSLAQHVLADELASLSAELASSLNCEESTSPTLLEELETLHRNLKELENVRSYVAVIDHALCLSEAATAEVQRSMLVPQQKSFSLSTLTEYRKLQIFISTVSSTCSTIEDSPENQTRPPTRDLPQSLQLTSFLVEIRDRTWKAVKGLLSSKLLESAEKMGWPQPINYLSNSSDARMLFESAFINMIKLQDLGDEIHSSDKTWKRDGIYPIQALIAPIALRFKFHFEGKRETNRLDKPEWYFTHVLNVTHSHRLFLEEIVQALLSKTAHGHINAFREFTLHLLPLLSRKLQYTVPRILQHASLLAHTIYQALAFDASLREQGFVLESTSAFSMTRVSDGNVAYWEGISDQILGQRDWFEAWLEGERKFADDQYNETISSSDAWQVVDDGNNGENDSEWKTTNSARRVKALIEQITDRYQPLPRFSERTRFLIGIQIPILESYHSRISSSLDAFESLSSSLMRAVPGALAGQVGHGTDQRRLTSGIDGVGRLAKAALSAYFMVVEMEGWGDDVFFLELWAEINSRAALRPKPGVHSHPPGPTREVIAEAELEAVSKGTIFQELITQYCALAGRAEDMIVSHVCSEVESASKAYFLKKWDGTDDRPADERGISAPRTLVVPISLLSAHLAFLASSFPASLTVVLYRRIATTISNLLLQRRIFQRGVGGLSLSEAKQVAEECLLWIQACRMTVSRVTRRVDSPWHRLLGAMRLLTLETDQFRVVVDRLFNTSTVGLEELQNELGLAEFDLGDMIDIVSLREDCRK